jgi:lipoate-protein ligase A
MVLHHKEVTYSLCSSDTKIFSSSLKESYRRISEALVIGLKKMGLNSNLAGKTPALYIKGNLPCFSFPAQDEIEISGRKIIGSAQKRMGSKFLQHGSIPLEKGSISLSAVSKIGEEEKKLSFVSLSEALGKNVDYSWMIANLSEGFSEFFGISLNRKDFGVKEKEEILKIQQKKYENPSWTFMS